MAFEALPTILTTSLSIIAWPPFGLLCPLYASILTMESDSHPRNQRCLAFWVIFSLFKIIESEVAVLRNWIPWWTHLEGMATILLVLPYFGSSSYIYNYFIKRHFTDNMCTRIWNVLFSQTRPSFPFDGHCNLADVSDRTTIVTEIERKKPIAHQGIYESYDCGSNLLKSFHTKPTGIREVQKEWSCALCQISTTSENCLGAHLQGKKHKAMEKELKAVMHVTKKRTKGLVLLENLNQVANFLTPVSRSIRWCRWEKPDFGWTKLNTDGSKHKEIASFGGLLRDFRGEPICAFVSKAPHGDIFMVELWAIWRGLVLALGLGIKVIWVESDSMSVVKNINKEHPPNPKADSCLKHIWKLLNKFEKYKVSHSWRETNRAADHLAKMVLQGNDVVLWPIDFPDILRNIISDDAEGKKYPRC